MTNQQPTCIVCKKSSQEIPLLTIDFQGQQYSICPQHLPILIHHPEQLTGLLPGSEKLKAYEA